MQFKIPILQLQQLQDGNEPSKTIGTGGFARVKMAKHDLTNIEVAVKIINKKNMKNKNMISKVKREIRILKFINHPNIIKLYEVLDTNNDIFVIMELANNGELFDNIQSKRISEEEAKFYFKQIINGVQYIHRNHISHRDLKPENILIDSNNLIKIGDFGLSNVMKDGKLLKTACGSPYYAAPQIVSEKKYEGTSVDIWSCGVILFALNTGELPFNDDNITLLYKRIEHGAYQIPPGVSPHARDLITRMLQVDPRRRISIQDIKAHPWMRSQIPIYKKLTDQFIVFKEEQPEIDEQVLQQIKLLNLNFNGYTQQKIQKVILKRDDESFVIAYELLKSDKDRKLYSQIREALQQGGNTIFKKIDNHSLPQFPPPIEPVNDKFLYGRQFDKNPKLLAQKIVQVLRMLNVDYEIKNQQYCMKCSYANEKSKKSSQVEMRDESEQHEYSIKKEDKFTKGVLRFTIQVYEVNRKSQTHLVDMCLNQGHPLVFFPLVRKFYAELEESYYK